MRTAIKTPKTLHLALANDKRPMALLPSAPAVDAVGRHREVARWLEQARDLLLRATMVEEAKNVLDAAALMAELARRRDLGEEAERAAAKVKVDATIRIGELSASLPKAPRGGPGGTKAPATGVLGKEATLKAAGIAPQRAREAERAARIPEPVRQKYMATVTVPTIEGLMREVRQAAHAERVAEVERRSSEDARAATHVAEIRQQDALEFLRSIEPATVDLLLTDPLYMTDVDDVETFARSWLTLALSRLKPTGRAYVFVGSYPREVLAYLRVAASIGRLPQQKLVWTYENRIGPEPKRDYRLNSQEILYWRGPEAPDLDCVSLLELCSVQTAHAPDGRWGKVYHRWQKPDDLAERLVRHGSKAGDLVLDPFAGTGTFLVAAAKFGRRAIGSDTDPKMIEIAVGRGAKLGKNHGPCAAEEKRRPVETTTPPEPLSALDVSEFRNDVGEITDVMWKHADDLVKNWTAREPGGASRGKKSSKALAEREKTIRADTWGRWLRVKAGIERLLHMAGIGDDERVSTLTAKGSESQVIPIRQAQIGHAGRAQRQRGKVQA